MPEDYFAFSDEKGSGQERYWGIAVVSGPSSSRGGIRQKLSDVLKRSNLDALEWKDLKGDSRYQNAAKEYVDAAIATACSKTLRIDILIWDMQDSRHATPGRDDTQNLARMYYHVLTHCGRTWGKRQWRLYPDNNSALDWDDIAYYIRQTSVTKSKPYLISLFEENLEHFDILEIKMQDSVKEPLVQLADLFVGMGCFSIQKRDKLKRWIQAQKRRYQPPLFSNNDDEHDEESRAEQARFDLIDDLNRCCKNKSLGVSLETKGHLWTPEPQNPINFWLYEPQHDLDKAPTK